MVNAIGRVQCLILASNARGTRGHLLNVSERDRKSLAPCISGECGRDRE
jgi:hypothetical protein